MQQHHQDQRQHSNPSLPVSVDNLLDNRIETYLDQVCAPLIRNMQPEAIAQIRSEMRTHIESLIEANLELGCSSEAAVAHALEQFGRQGTVSRDWRRATASVGGMRQPLAAGLTCAVGAYLVALTAVPVAMRYTQDMGMAATQWVTNFQLFMLPAVAGLLTGMFAARRPVRAALISMLTLAIPIGVVEALQSISTGPTMWQIGLVSGIVTTLVCWLPVSCAFSCIGAGVKWLVRRPRRASARG